MLDTSSGEGLLDSLVSTPASAFGKAVSLAQGAAGALQQREKRELERNLPEIEQPTGIPPKAGPAKAAATQLPPGKPPEAPAPGPRTGKDVDTRHVEASGPVPGANVPTAAGGEPASEEGGSWWSWLTSRLQNFFGSLPTTDPNVNTSAGPTPQVDLSGEANPAQNAEHQQASDTEVAQKRTEADSATSAHFGEGEIAPTVKPQKLRASTKPGPPAAGAGGAGSAPAGAPQVPPDMLAQFDAEATPELSAQMQQKAAQQRRERAEYERKSGEAQREGRRQIAEATKDTEQEQKGLKDQAQADVTGERKRWQEENKRIERTYGTQASTRRREIDTQIKSKVDTTHREAGEKLAAAEQHAQQEKQKAEQQAAEKKREEENKPHSFWDSVKGAIGSAFDAIKGAVTAIFDGLRKLVKGIIEAAKKAVNALIDAARDAIKGLIKGFGEFVKGLVTIALAAFPEAAARARAWIDRRVEQANAAVDRAAERLKKAVDTILDAIGAAIDLALSVMQKALIVALDVAEFIAKGPFEILELLEKFAKFMLENGKFLEGAKKVKDDPDSILGAMKSALGAMIAEVPGKAIAAVTALAGKLGARAQKHVNGILRHLKKGLDHLKEHWWDELKTLGKTLIWPWPTVFKTIGEVWTSIKACASAAFHLELSKAIDEFIKIQQGVNTILGAVYGWFFIASVLVGAIIGAFFGGAGALPGAAAGAAFAGEVGEGLALAVVGVETENIVKATVDIALLNKSDRDDERSYDRIAGSTLTIGVIGALILLGEIAAQLARAVWDAVAGFFKGEKPPALGAGEAPKPGEGTGEAPKPGEGKTGEPKLDEPKANEPKADEPKVDEPKADEPKADEPKTDEPKTDEPAEDKPQEEKPVEEQFAACFVAGTLVDLGAATRPIETIERGDLVLAQPPDDDEDEDGDPLFRVFETHRSRARRLVRLRAGGGDLVCTRRHPFYVVGDGWVRAADLRPGAVLQAKNGSTVTLSAAEDVRLELEAQTFNFRVERAATYFVCLGGQSVLVHNGGPDDYNYDRILYWLLQKKPSLRPGDTDGLSVWKTNSRAEVEKLLETRVKVDGRSPKDPHSFYTPEQLEAAGIKPEPTPGEGALADAGFEHNSVRPTEAPDAKVPLTEEQMKLLEEKIGKAGDPTPVKPKDLKCG